MCLGEEVLFPQGDGVEQEREDEGEDQENQSALEEKRADEEEIERKIDGVAAPGVDAGGDERGWCFAVNAQAPCAAEMAKSDSIGGEACDHECTAEEVKREAIEEWFLESLGPE